MADVFTPAERSEIMGRIRAADTKPERRVRSLLHRAGFRFRLHRADLPGKPDIVLPKYRAAVFVHGCFWHGHSCKNGHRPRSNASYWNAKLDRNKRRDVEVAERFEGIGWNRIVIWECELKAADLEQRLKDQICR